MPHWSLFLLGSWRLLAPSKLADCVRQWQRLREPRKQLNKARTLFIDFVASRRNDSLQVVGNHPSSVTLSDSLAEETRSKPPVPATSEAVSASGAGMPRDQPKRVSKACVIGGTESSNLVSSARESVSPVLSMTIGARGPASPGSVSLDVTRERDVLAANRLALAAFL